MCYYLSRKSYVNSGKPRIKGYFMGDQTFHYCESLLYFVQFHLLQMINLTIADFAISGTILLDCANSRLKIMTNYLFFKVHLVIVDVFRQTNKTTISKFNCI